MNRGSRFCSWEEEPAREVTAPLHELHYIRSRVKAHEAGSDADAIRKRVLKEHKTFAHHFRTLCARTDETMTTLANALGALP